MELRTKDFDGYTVVSVQLDRSDAMVAIQFKDMMKAIGEAGQPRIVLDMAQVGFVDSSGLGAVVAAMKMIGREKTLELSGLTPTVAKVFRLTRLDSVFKIHSDLGSATDGAVLV